MEPKISVAIATFNEGKNIKRCLDSVKDWVDEIVVVDGGSTDKTVEIVKKFGAKVIATNNPPIFHINKQKAIDKCSGDWILQLDADEEVTSELRKEIQTVIGNWKLAFRQKPRFCGAIGNFAQAVGYYLPRRNFLLGHLMRKGGLYPDYVIRLFKREKGKFPCKTVHEQIEIDGEVGYLKNPLIHRPYPQFSEYLKKANAYTSLTAQRLMEEDLKIDLFTMGAYLIIKPIKTFLSLYLRHFGFLDGFPGLVWAVFSALHHPTAYIKYWEQKNKKER